MISKYNFQIYCITEQNYVYSWDTVDIAPTVCPNNSLHTINNSATSIIQKLVPEKSLVISSINNSYKSSTNTRVRTEIFQGSVFATALSNSFMDSDVTSYTIQILDKNNAQILLSTTLNNTSESIQNLGILSNLPSSSTQIEILIKKNGGSASSKVYIESITIFYV